MSQLKENVFVIGLVVVVLVLGAGFWFLVWSPAANLSAQTKSLEKVEKSISDYLREEELPTERRRALAVERTEAARKQFDEGVEAFSRRPSKFKLFFDDSPVPPDPSAFFSRYMDRINGANGLRATYRKEFNIAPSVDEEAAKQPPLVETIDAAQFEVGGAEAEERVRQAMKQVRIVESIFAACTELRIAGLREIRFPSDDMRRRSRSDDTRRGSAAEPEKKDEVLSTVREVQVDVQLRRHQIQELLVALARDDRVPFLEPKAVDYVQVPTEQERFASLKVVRDYPSETQAREQAYSDMVQEPRVDCRLTLQVLDWTGVKLVQAEENK